MEMRGNSPKEFRIRIQVVGSYGINKKVTLHERKVRACSEIHAGKENADDK